MKKIHNEKFIFFKEYLYLRYDKTILSGKINHDPYLPKQKRLKRSVEKMLTFKM